MKDALLKISEYAEQQEQRIATLEARLEDALTRYGQAMTAIAALQQQVTTLTQRLAEMEAKAIQQPIENDDEPEVEVELIVDEDAMTEPEQAEEKEPEPVVEEKPQLIVEPQPEPQPVVEPQPGPVVEQKAEPQPESQPVVKPEPQPVRPVQTSLFGTPVQDIRQAISLGDRFLFQRELFGGSGELMLKTLDILNGKHSLGEAEAYIADTFSWNKESSTTELFMNVLRRRFAQ